MRGLPKQPARTARLGQFLAQQPPVAVADLSRLMPPARIRRRPLLFGDIKGALGRPPWKTLDAFFFPVLQLYPQHASQPGQGAAGWPTAGLRRLVTEQRRPAQGRRLLHSFLCFLFLPVFPSPQKPRAPESTTMAVWRKVAAAPPLAPLPVRALPCGCACRRRAAQRWCQNPCFGGSRHTARLCPHSARPRRRWRRW
jgi:hypothetical protein